MTPMGARSGKPVRCWLVATFIGLTLPAGAAGAAGPVSDEVIVTGAVKTPLALKVADLKAFPAEQIGTVTVTRRVDDKDTASTVRGVRLSAVLERAGFAATDPNDWKHTIVLAIASDGYRVAFSWPEVFNSEATSGMLVALTSACIGSHHLWQDLGEAGRGEVSRLLEAGFPELFRSNVHNLRWKHHLFAKPGERLGRDGLRPPHCDGCEDYEFCFGVAVAPLPMTRPRTASPGQAEETNA